MPRQRRGRALFRNGEAAIGHSTLTVSLLEPALLILIRERSRHGYTLLTDLEALGMGTIHPSVVYRTLREMERLNWIESNWDKCQSQGPPRRTYTLTDQGETALQYWQQELNKNRDAINHLLERMRK